ncbi:MAG: UvrD-helicase domain-containing protein, partial [Xanthomonadales bacterium]|nr:UvrD-helicase domain-containing protein [Xanthomonadales bacterium]
MTADRAIRVRALDPGQSFIVQAPAGSGKTEVLTQRFLRLLATVERPERVLAITFTRKATQEMRTRIITRLAQASEGDVPETEHERQAVAFAAEVLRRDREQGWNLLESPGRLRINTIDGLCTQVLARDPVLGARWSDVPVLEHADPLYRESVRRMFQAIDSLVAEGGREAEGMRDALVRLLVELGGDSRRLESLLVEMLKQRSLWRRHLETGHEALEALLRLRQARALESFRSTLGAERVEEAVVLATTLGFDTGDIGHTAESPLLVAYRLADLLTDGSNQPRKPGGINKRLFPDMTPDQAPVRDR